MLPGGTPVLLADPDTALALLQEAPVMLAEYGAQAAPPPPRLRDRLRARLADDHRTPASLAAFEGLMAGLAPEALALSIGGGPLRAHPALTTLNLGAFPNVDVVGDAHQLPYADGSAAAVHIEAVLEHLARPELAVAEIHRVLAPGGRVYACTPFLQPYHGYPHHYQNFTLTGHVALFERQGFRIVEAGPCVGPVYMLTTLVTVLIGAFCPTPMRRPASWAWQAVSAVLRPLDRRLGTRPEAHLLASTTYLVAEKPLAAAPASLAGPPRV